MDKKWAETYRKQVRFVLQRFILLSLPGCFLRGANYLELVI